ncbi:Acetylornithine deacetylase/Succinyl-diaminopimelate desuccinylase [Lutimaribacter pacificus]|uniref:Acetylornithine deacetylase/Succinyl-diaminopimelate desuccinylase n=1 Tax=Lutimaribacter pacificus TaxID=391948 RepID=A0A1H0GGB4_9RHOB|nr:M20/M25/M40 family metallo-hydrolase [Lutimaribacter pacificus]SDO05912.1 Acetylornithine deacetylase/Succinyl-diaminopimelate desuccinylase [Lutimaribacter pacificus]SHJ88004.1 Acetylornithine deacetylase/Succinyl-diaminopimelate desuccinylase [Lutimaribacter pacificus]
MTDTARDKTIQRAKGYLDSGEFLETLARLVSVQTESHPPLRKPELERYCHDVMGPYLEGMGFETRVFDNSLPQHGPFLVAEKIENPALPTVLVYGHGDVVRAMPERWRDDLDPWALKVEGDRVFGRGTVDNKGQHLIAIEALRAVIEERGQLGFNAKVLIEMGEEAGSPGLAQFLQDQRDLLAADVFIALDGPRQSMEVADITLGTRGGIAVDLVVNLREGSHHSGHWGGLLKDPAVVLSHAISTIISRDGRILVEGWRPRDVPESVREASRKVQVKTLPGTPEPDEDWGEPGMSRTERIYAWNSAIVLSMISGQPENPVAAVSGFARARIQLRHTVDTRSEEVAPALRRHLDEQGFPEVEVQPVAERDMFPPSRTDPENPWVLKVAASMKKTMGKAPNIIPTIGASGPSEFFKETLGTPIMWIPQSYGGCGQHGPDEHGLLPLYDEGLAMMAGVFWDFGEASGT